MGIFTYLIGNSCAKEKLPLHGFVSLRTSPHGRPPLRKFFHEESAAPGVPRFFERDFPSAGQGRGTQLADS